MALTINLTGVEATSNKDTDGTLALNSDTKYPSQKAVKTYADTKQAALGYTAENTANKDATGGYAGLTLFKINFKNTLNTFTSFFTNSNTAARTYTFKDADGTIAFTSDITGTNSGTNTGDETAARIGTLINGSSAATCLLPCLPSKIEVSIANLFGLLYLRRCLASYLQWIV